MFLITWCPETGPRRTKTEFPSDEQPSPPVFDGNGRIKMTQATRQRKAMRHQCLFNSEYCGFGVARACRLVVDEEACADLLADGRTSIE